MENERDRIENNNAHDFTLGLALFDYVPVWLFTFAVLLLASGWPLRVVGEPEPVPVDLSGVTSNGPFSGIVANPSASYTSHIGHTVFCIGALVAVFAGFAKATWKLLLVLQKQGGAKRVRQKTVDFLGARFLARQSAGLVLMFLGFIIAHRAFRWKAIGAILASFPAVLFLALLVLCFLATGYVRAKKFERLGARSNWIAEILNCGMQASFLALVLSLLAA